MVITLDNGQTVTIYEDADLFHILRQVKDYIDNELYEILLKKSTNNIGETIEDLDYQVEKLEDDNSELQNDLEDIQIKIDDVEYKIKQLIKDIKESKTIDSNKIILRLENII